MKKLRRTVYASTSVLDSKYTLTPNQVCQLLSTITQLRGNTIVAEESPEGTLQFVIGNDVYKIQNKKVTPPLMYFNGGVLLYGDMKVMEVFMYLFS